MKRATVGHRKRQLVFNMALLAGLFILGSLCGVAGRTWIGGIKAQHAQLERCILSSRQSHTSDDAQSRLAHLDAEVPLCMNASGYEQALGNQSCSAAFWQGDVFCYLPKGSLGKLIYRMEAASAGKSIPDPRKTELSARQG